jgi:hypothetical protein
MNKLINFTDFFFWIVSGVAVMILGFYILINILIMFKENLWLLICIPFVFLYIKYLKDRKTW